MSLSATRPGAAPAILRNISAKKERLKREYRSSLFNTSKYLLGYRDLELSVHGKLCDICERTYWGEFDRLVAEKSIHRFLDLLPRGSFKTSVVTISWPVWILLQDEPDPDTGEPIGGVHRSFNGKPGYDQRILIGQETDPNALLYLDSIKSHLTQNRRVVDLFGPQFPKKSQSRRRQLVDDDEYFESVYKQKWKSREADIRNRRDLLAKEPNLRITSLQTAINSGHYDIGIMDDIFAEKQVTNPEQIEAVHGFYRRLMPIMEKPSVLTFVGTRWNDRDIYGTFTRPASKGGESEKWHTYIESAERSPEEIAAGADPLFFPQILSQEVLDDLKTSMLLHLYHMQYNNRVVDQSTALFKHKYFEASSFPLSAGHTLQQWLSNMTVIVTSDPAISDDKKGCYAVVMAVAWDVNGEPWVIDMVREKGMSPGEFVDYLFEFYQRWSPVWVGVETEGFQRILLYNANQLSRERKVWPPFVELKTLNRTKEKRILGLEPMARIGKVHIRDEYYETLVEEFTRFPRGESKDAIDAFAYQLDIAFAKDKGQAVTMNQGNTEIAGVTQLNEVQAMLMERARRLNYHNVRGGGLVQDWYNG